MELIPGDRADAKANPQSALPELTFDNGVPAMAPGYPPEGRHPVLSSSWNPEGMVKALQRRWLLAGTLGLICGGMAAAAAWFLMPPGKVSARAVLRVASFPEYVVFPSTDSRGDFQNYQRTQIALVKDHDVLQAALRRPKARPLDVNRLPGDEKQEDLAGDEKQEDLNQLRLIQAQDEPVDWLERELKVDYSLAPEILSISLSGDKPDELLKIVNGVRRAYLSEIIEKEREKRKTKLKSLVLIRDDFEKRVKEKRRVLKALAEAAGSNDAATLHVIQQLNESFLHKTREELLRVTSDIQKLEAEAAAEGMDLHFMGPLPDAKPASEMTVPKKALEEYLKNDPGYKSLQAKKFKLEGDMEDARRVSTAGDKSAAVQKYKKELAAVEELLEAKRQEVRPQLISDYQERMKAERANYLASIQKRLNSLQVYKASVENDVKTWEKQIRDARKNTINLEDEKAELEQLEDSAKKLSHQVEVMQLEKDAPNRVTPLGKAHLVHPDNLKRKLMASGLAGFGSLGLVLLLIAWVEYRPRRVHSVDEVQELGMKLVGTVPALPSRRQFRLLNSNGDGDAHWHSILTESVDTARTMLLHSARLERTQMVMVTSATGGEGKTSLSSHLAASLARAGRKTLLVDCDLRNPSLHRLFGTQRSPGLCEVLRQEVQLAEVIWQTPAQRLWLIPAGQCDGRAVQALAQDNFKNIAEALRPGYDFIVLDSAPVLPVADSLLVAQHVDAVIFSILRDVSRLPKVYTAHQRLERLGIRMLGAVVSGTHVDTYAPEYQYVTRFED